MTAALQQQTQQPGFKHPWMSPKQAKWLYDLINTRIGAADLARFEDWKRTYFDISSRAEFENAINTLRSMPVLTAKVPETAAEEGLYLDPNTLKLYRLTANKNGQLIVSIYSETAVRRIDASSDQEVRKGTWKRLSVLDSRLLLTSTDYVRKYGRAKSEIRILAEWRMTDQDKIDWRTGRCNFCHRPLEDPRSKRRNYGPDCAAQRGLPWGD